jgi:teichuronic acid exporter
VIGKYFSARELGFFTRAQMFKDLPAHKMNNIMSRVTYPVLSQMQDNPAMLKAGYKKMIKSIMFISFVLMAGMAAVAEPMVITLIGEQWRPSIIYLQLLCFVGMMYPLHALNLNMLQVLGRSDLFLKLEIIKKLIAVPVIIIGIFWGIKVMILGMWANTLIAYYLNSYWSGHFIDYSMREQIADIMPSFLLALFMGTAVFFAGWMIPAGNLVKLAGQVLFGGAIVFIVSEMAKIDSYLYIKNIVLTQPIFIPNARK